MSAAAAAAARPSLSQIALFFLRVGAVLYGGGYVLLAFLEHCLVQRHAWLTQQQLLTESRIAIIIQGLTGLYSR